MKENPYPSNLRGKKARHLECTLGPCHWMHEISLPFPKEFVTIFGLRYYSLHPTYW
jgi:hypothetical protein